MQKPQFMNYGHYSSANYGAHTLRFDHPDGSTFWFSYKTLVAFQAAGKAIVVHENDWSTTTGKHLNWIDGGSAMAKQRRVSATEFNKLLVEQFGQKVAA